MTLCIHVLCQTGADRETNVWRLWNSEVSNECFSSSEQKVMRFSVNFKIYITSKTKLCPSQKCKHSYLLLATANKLQRTALVQTEGTPTLIKLNKKMVRLTLRFLQHGHSKQSIRTSVTHFISGHTHPQFFSNIYLNSLLIW